jgi:hypothetical protein
MIKLSALVEQEGFRGLNLKLCISTAIFVQIEIIELGQLLMQQEGFLCSWFG